MKIDDAVETIAKFFNDLIGALVPGVVLVAGLCVAHFGPATTMTFVKAMDSTPFFLLSLCVMFAVGHALSAMFEAGETLLTKELPKQQAKLQAKNPTAFLLKQLATMKLPKGFDTGEAMKRQSYNKFLDIVNSVGTSGSLLASPDGTWNYNDLRNVALSVSTEAASVGRRFMFISLLCNGVGTALLLLAADYASCLLFSPHLLHAYSFAMNCVVQIFLLLLLAYVLFRRGREFNRRAMTTPFSIALAEKSLKGS